MGNYICKSERMGVVWLGSSPTMLEDCRSGRKWWDVGSEHILVSPANNPRESGHNTGVYGER